MTSSRDCVCADTLRTDVKINAVAKKICFIGTISFVIKAKGRDWVCETTTRCKAELARPRTFPQHTLPLLPLLRSRPGGVHKASVVRSPGSDIWLSITRGLNLRLAMREQAQESIN